MILAGAAVDAVAGLAAAARGHAVSSLDGGEVGETLIFVDKADAKSFEEKKAVFC